MSLHIKGNPRPALTLAAVVIIAVLIALLIRQFGYFWVMVTPNVFALSLIIVMLFAYNEADYIPRAKPGELPPLSVIIPSYNSKSTIMGTIGAIKASDYPGKMEIIVVDDGSTDGSREMLKGVKGITLLLMGKNRGKAAAINRAVKTAKYEAIACVDSDSYPERSALREAVAILAKNENIGIVTCFIRVANQDSLLKKLQDIEYVTGFGFFQMGARFLDAITVAPGPTSVYRKSILQKVGGFDEHNITEDLEIAWRMRKFGYDIEYTPHAVSYTEAPGNLRDLLKQRLRWYRGKFFNIRKHKDMFFNRKYGLFSTFVLPFSFSGELSGVALTFSLAYVITNQLAWAVQYMNSLFALGQPLLLNMGGMVVMSEAAVVMSLLLMSPWFIVVYLSYSIGKRGFDIWEIPVVALFFFAYSILISFFYCMTFLKEVNRSDYKWK